MEEYTNYLVHHGVKGMKWGVRRYQNADGSLTAKGRKKYLNSSSKKLYKTLKKEVRKQRGKEHGTARRWESGTPIGPNSEKLQKQVKAKRELYKNSPEYKSWEKKYDRFQKEETKKWENGTFDSDYYDKKDAEIWKARPKKNFNDTGEWAYVVGKGFTDDFVNKGGKDLTMAYLKDLGFNDSAAKQLTNRMLLKKKTLGAI